MKFSEAKGLHNGDQVTIKRTGEVTEVISSVMEGKNILIHAMTSDEGYDVLHHIDVD